VGLIVAENNDANSKLDIRDGIMNQSLFLNNLELWIDEIISGDGLADKELIEKVRGKFELAMQANITHHRYMAKNGDGITMDRHRLMAEIYETLLQQASRK
jgi:hypothetical protein